ncbi:hypothetical protein GCM10010211_85620 [Streptomyces albospinus]|uniref:Dioxygenase n=1 Tax=Streptomyces albospinus TaxID=285515 RepID=A0ABQ2VRV5_9ACTN|nr:carotenoid oxygenase family protein [Streptomyces albospinus]GGV05677.1 hypothetical protein GCM10010211_85620 [Streptomyces albospinus]
MRWTIGLATRTVHEERLDDRRTEFPRIDDRLAGVPARYGYATTLKSPDGHDCTGAIHRYDLRSSTTVSHTFAAGRTPGEPTFAPADTVPGRSVWLMTHVYDATTDRSDLVMLDADDPTAPRTATIHLPRRVPVGFHGNWLPDQP